MANASPDLAVRLPDPSQRPRRRGGRHLKVIPVQGRRRSPALPVLLCSGVVLVFLFAVAAMHALLIDGQIRLDDIQNDVASESATVERLRLQVAELEAPDRILGVAQERLGMQEPSEIGYVLPDGAAADAELLRVPAATIPPPPTTAAPVVTVSPVDTGVDTGVDDAVAAALASAGVDVSGDAEPDATGSTTTDSTATAQTPPASAPAGAATGADG